MGTRESTHASESGGVAALPAFVALDSRAVLEGERRGASVQISESYFGGQTAVIDSLETAPPLSERREVAAQSRELYDQIHIDFDSLTRETLQTASAKFRRILRQMPEVQYLARNFPGTCFVVPEWLRLRGRVDYGARVYFFREDSAPAPDEILDRNIDAVVRDDGDRFEQYQGRLHGYPDCCVDHFSTHARREGSAPELEAIEPIADDIDEEATRQRSHSTSIEDVVDGLVETPDVYAFFTREFYPEPGCDRARQQGLSVYETLSAEYPETLVEDYVRINAGWSYLMAKAIEHPGGDTKAPSPGALGREHLLFYLPLSSLLTSTRYHESDDPS
jgi:hypothetical protein